jgi:hypothetical protein
MSRSLNVLHTAAAIAALSLTGCAWGLDFDSYSRDCELPRFDVTAETSTPFAFCSGDWGDDVRQPTTADPDAFARVGSAIQSLEGLVAVASLEVVAGTPCSRAVLTADIYERSATGLRRVAHGLFNDATESTPLADGQDCTLPARSSAPSALDVELINVAPPYQVVIAGGSLGLFVATLVLEDAPAGDATLQRLPAERFLAPPAEGVSCTDGRCVAAAGRACVEHADCDTGFVCERDAGITGTCKARRQACSGAPCTTTSSLACSDGECRALCTSDRDCPGFESCTLVAGASFPGGQASVCTATCGLAGGGATCVGADFVCLEGLCTGTCASDGDCAGGRTCVEGGCVVARCDADAACGIGGVGTHEGLVSDVALIRGLGRVTVLVAANLAGLYRTTLTPRADGTVAFPDRIDADRIASQALRVTADADAGRVYALSWTRGLEAYRLTDVRDADAPAPYATVKLRDEASSQTGISLAALDDSVFVLQGGFLDNDACLTPGTVSGETFVHGFSVTDTAIERTLDPLAIGLCGAAQAGFVDGTTLGISCPPHHCGSEGIDTSRDDQLSLRLFDIATPGTATFIAGRTLSANAPRPVGFEPETAQYLRIGALFTGVAYVVDGTSIAPFEISLSAP